MKKYNNLGLLVKMAKQQQQLKKDILKQNKKTHKQRKQTQRTTYKNNIKLNKK